LVVRDDAVNDTGALLGWSLRVIALNQTPAELQSTELEGVHAAIPDGGTLTTTLTILNQHAPLSRVSLEPDIDHSHSSDLSIYLRSPNNVTLTVSTGNGLEGVFDGTEWYDAAGNENPPGPVTDNAMTAGVLEPYLAPEEPFAAVNGMDGNGDWLLTITDNVVNGSTGEVGAIWMYTLGAACQPQVNVYAAFGPEFVLAGLPVTYTVWAGNDGYTATNIIVTSTLPLNAPFLAGSAPGLDCVFPPVESVGGTVVCTRPTLGPQDYLSIDLQLRAPSLPAEMTSTAEITHSGIDLFADDATNDEDEMSHYYSANGNPWDVDDRHGGIDDGGQDAFDTWGQLRLRIYEGGTLLETTLDLGDFNLVAATGKRWETTTPVLANTLSVSRVLLAPASENWLRYVDTITNLGANARTVYVTWGGDLGSDSETKLDATSSGNLVLDTGDTWATTIDDSYPEIDAPVGYVLRNLADPTYQGPRRSTHPLTDPWPATGDDDLGHVYRLDLAPGETERLAYFVIRGLGEGQEGPEDCEDYGGCTTPVTGTQTVAARFVALGLAVNPPLCDILGPVANWPGAQDDCERVYLPTILR
jgi:subtilisin-like proprotein convertase family protein